MKRTVDGDAVDAFDPLACFHREVLIAEQWATIRNDFLAALNSQPRVLIWKEPRKLWRYSQEALGKWILSQIARVPPEEDMRSVFFFPSAALFGAIPAAKRSSGSMSYDEQLLRDLTMKSNGVDEPTAVAAILQIVSTFDLAKRCAAAHDAIAERMQQRVSSENTYKPRVRRLEPDDEARTPGQKRIHGPLIEVTIDASRQAGQARSSGRGRAGPRVSASVPLAAWEKLLRTYAHFSAEAEAARYPNLSRTTLAEYRAAAVVLRYEATLSTGSLQLCADTSLKQHLHAAGYHVMDLCASPINAYMGGPRPGVFVSSSSSSSGQTEGASDAASSPLPIDASRVSSLEEEVENPNHFCSAFYDVDRFFGSLGSALHVDPIALYRDATANSGARPLLLTLDVPYDEDLCEELFQKLARDMKRQEEVGHTSQGGASPVHVDYVLVLPIWWDVPIPIQKRYFTDAEEPGSAEEASMVKAVVADRTKALTEGYKVSYTWPEDLGRACTRWACFDGLFVGGQYSYFCTNTNRWLRGVTATEVIALAQPTHTMLQEALKAYYGRV